MNPDSTYYVSAPFHYQPDPYTAAWDVHDLRPRPTPARSRSTNATLRSDNTVYAQLTSTSGPDKVARDGAPARHPVDARRRPAMGLGSDAISPLEEASAYATLAAGGIYSKPMAIRRSILANGKVDTDAGWGKPQRERVISRRGRLRGDADPRGERARRHRRRRLLRPARRGQDRHDREPRRRLVLRLRAAARDDGLGRLPAGRDPDGERARGLGPGRHLPGDDLAALHGGGDGEAAGARLAPAAEPGDLAAVHAGAVRVEPRADADVLPPTTTTTTTTTARTTTTTPPTPTTTAETDRAATAAAPDPPPPPPPAPPPPPPRLATTGAVACGWRCAPRPSRPRSTWPGAPFRTEASSARPASATCTSTRATRSAPARRASVPRRLRRVPARRVRGVHAADSVRERPLQRCLQVPDGAVRGCDDPARRAGARRARSLAAPALRRGRAVRALAGRARADLAEHLRRLAGAADRARRCWLFLRGATCSASRVLGLAVTAKVYPLVLVPLAGIFVWRRAGARAASRSRWELLLLVAAAVVAPFAAYAPHGVFESFRSQAERGLQVESLGAAFLLVPTGSALYDAQVVRRPGSPGGTCRRRCRCGRARDASCSKRLAVAAVWVALRARAGRAGSPSARLRRRDRRVPRVHEGLLAAVPGVARAARRARRGAAGVAAVR